MATRQHNPVLGILCHWKLLAAVTLAGAILGGIWANRQPTRYSAQTEFLVEIGTEAAISYRGRGFLTHTPVLYHFAHEKVELKDGEILNIQAQASLGRIAVGFSSLDPERPVAVITDVETHLKKRLTSFCLEKPHQMLAYCQSELAEVRDLKKDAEQDAAAGLAAREKRLEELKVEAEMRVEDARPIFTTLTPASVEPGVFNPSVKRAGVLGALGAGVIGCVLVLLYRVRRLP